MVQNCSVMFLMRTASVSFRDMNQCNVSMRHLTVLLELTPCIETGTSGNTMHFSIPTTQPPPAPYPVSNIPLCACLAEVRYRAKDEHSADMYYRVAYGISQCMCYLLQTAILDSNHPNALLPVARREAGWEAMVSAEQHLRPPSPSVPSDREECTPHTF